jgi:hypothetical protein
MAKRLLGYANPAQRYFIELESLPADSPWRQCAETEKWFANSPERLPPPKKLGVCGRATERPLLDGQLDEPFWKSAERLTLQGTSAKSAKVRFAHDPQFLYVAISCPKVDLVEYAADESPRPRDADLAQYDNVSIRLDLDRDYTTAFELSVDQRGWTHDACWEDVSWNPSWYVAAQADHECWTIEAAIPLAEMTAEPPTARTVWAVSLERTIPRGGRQLWSGQAAAAESPDRYGLLIFE